MEIIHKGWLFTRDNDKFAPFTLADNILTKEGQSFKLKIESRLLSLEKTAQNLNSSIQKMDKQIGKFSSLQQTTLNLQSDLSRKPGLLVEGKGYEIEAGLFQVAGPGAEIFNDLTNNIALGNYSHAEG
jgi:uncharacterized protein YlxW (UPF0749 family)